MERDREMETLSYVCVCESERVFPGKSFPETLEEKRSGGEIFSR